MLGYELRNTPNIILGGWDMAFNTFNINRPKRLSFNEWAELAKQLSGKTDVSMADRQVAVSASETANNPNMQQLSLQRDSYAAAEAAEGWHRQQHPNDPTEM